MLLCSAVVTADSLWKDGSSSPYTPAKSFKVGDVITILVMETTSASHKAGTKTDVKDDFSIKLSHSIDRLTPLIGTDNRLDFGVGNKYAGSGGTERASKVQTKIAVLVTEIMENGNLRIEGKHKVMINDENEEILVSGVVRSKDVSVQNTVYSYQVADADISIKGTGTLQEAEQPGWLTRMLNWLF